MSAENNIAANILSWVASGNYLLGAILFILGVVGASVTVYLTLGGYLPNINRSARMVELEAEIKDKTARLNTLQKKIDETDMERTAARDEYRKALITEPKLRTRTEILDRQIADYKDQQSRLQSVVNDSQTKYDNERKALQRTSTIFYIPLGGAFATFLAVDFLQALAIGAGWTAFISLTQLSKKDKEAAEERDKESEVMEEKYNELGRLFADQTDLVLKHQTESAAASQENKELKKAVAQMAKKLKEKEVRRI